MEAVGIQRQASIQLFSQVQHHYFMNTFSANFRAAISFHSSSSIKTRVLCTSSALVDTPIEPNTDVKSKVSKSIGNGRVRKGKTTSSSDAQLKENWLDSLTYPHSSLELASPWAIGIDPDVSGALALLKTEDSGISAQDDSRELASKLFPSLGSLLERKKDHGRAEALLIAAYGKGLKMKCNDDTSGATSQDSALP